MINIAGKNRYILLIVQKNKKSGRKKIKVIIKKCPTGMGVQGKEWVYLPGYEKNNDP